MIGSALATFMMSSGTRSPVSVRSQNEVSTNRDVNSEWLASLTWHPTGSESLLDAGLNIGPGQPWSLAMWR